MVQEVLANKSPEDIDHKSLKYGLFTLGIESSIDEIFRPAEVCIDDVAPNADICQ